MDKSLPSSKKEKKGKKQKSSNSNDKDSISFSDENSTQKEIPSNSKDAERKKEKKNIINRFLSLRKKNERRRASAAEKLDINLPIIVKLIDFLEHNERTFQTEGILRVSGSFVESNKLRALLLKDYGSVTLSKYDINDVASVLKMSLRDLSDPLLTFQLYEDFIETTEIDELESRLSALSAVLTALPPRNLEVLRSLFGFLHKIQTFKQRNKMTSGNLALVIGPNLLRRQGNDLQQMMEDSGKVVIVITTMIDHTDTLFEKQTPTVGELPTARDENGSALSNSITGMPKSEYSSMDPTNAVKELTDKLAKLELRFNEEVKQKTIIETYTDQLRENLLDEQHAKEELEIQNLELQQQVKQLQQQLNEKALETTATSNRMAIAESLLSKESVRSASETEETLRKAMEEKIRHLESAQKERQQQLEREVKKKQDLEHELELLKREEAASIATKQNFMKALKEKDMELRKSKEALLKAEECIKKLDAELIRLREQQVPVKIAMGNNLSLPKPSSKGEQPSTSNKKNAQLKMNTSENELVKKMETEFSERVRKYEEQINEITRQLESEIRAKRQLQFDMEQLRSEFLSTSPSSSPLGLRRVASNNSLQSSQQSQKQPQPQPPQQLQQQLLLQLQQQQQQKQPQLQSQQSSQPQPPQQLQQQQPQQQPSQEIKEQLFHWMCLSIKLNAMCVGKPCNFDQQALFGQLLQKNLPYSSWPKEILRFIGDPI